MIEYTIRRIIAAIPVIFIVGLIVFFIVHMIPGNPAAVMLGDEATEEEVEALTEKLGLNDPLPRQYVRWMGNALHGDLGDSLHYNKPVIETLFDKMEPSLILVIYAIVISIIIGIPLGIIAAINRETLLDKICMVISMIGISMPSFWLGMNLVVLLAVKNSIFPSVGYTPISENGIISSLYFLTLPAFALGLQRSASVARVTRSSMLEVLNNDYVRTARAKGLNEYSVIVKHALKNALIPVITQIGISFAHLAGGAVAIETIFNIPGIGSLAFESIKRRDYPMIQGHILLIAAIYIFVNLLVDLLYKYVDPRIDYSSK
ncbi:MAG: ABC transporter permease [Desulfitobacteriaceae bacterium]|nr:ABC transporter permease [Desulfitobacteriaceae bacterium]MDD4401895.1 ABC transporter permease [Desulfitobacteriaceae bacterium]